jgi:hypothetical protein
VWWNTLSDDERRLAAAEALRYEALTAEEQDAIWSEEGESLAVDAEGDEIDLPTNKRPA